jgi:serine/threonine protein kinase
MSTDTCTGEKVAIKKITSVFEHVSDATRILREIKLLRMLKHPGRDLSAFRPALLRGCHVLSPHGGPTATAAAAVDIVEIKHIMLPPSPKDFKDIYVVFELMETDLHQVRFVKQGLLPCMPPTLGMPTGDGTPKTLPSLSFPCPAEPTHPCHNEAPAHPQVIKANDDLTPEHHQFFLYQMLRGLKYIHSG